MSDQNDKTLTTKAPSPKQQKSSRELLHQTALEAPSQSGVYLWRDAEGTVIYVGKAKSLKSRLSSYFSGNKDIKTRLLVSHARSTRRSFLRTILSRSTIPGTTST